LLIITPSNDALRKHGILPPREPEPGSPSPPPSPTLDEILDDLQMSELQELVDDTGDDTTQRMLDAYQRKRLSKEREELKKARFGRVYPISRDDYTREVTEASKVSEDEEGTGVVCFLYKDGILRSDRTFQHVRTLAERYPHTKFVSIVGDKCIPNLPDSRVPVFILYKNGEIRNQFFAWGADQERRMEELEAILMTTAVVKSEKRRLPDGKYDNEEDEADARKQSSRRNPVLNAKKDGAGSDSGSDFEFDL